MLFLQLINAISTLDRNALNSMHQQLMDLRGCKGHKQCNPEKGERRDIDTNDGCVTGNLRLTLHLLPLRSERAQLLQRIQVRSPVYYFNNIPTFVSHSELWAFTAHLWLCFSFIVFGFYNMI